MEVKVPVRVEEQTCACTLTLSRFTPVDVGEGHACFSGILSLILKLICVMINCRPADLLQIHLAQTCQKPKTHQELKQDKSCVDSSVYPKLSTIFKMFYSYSLHRSSRHVDPPQCHLMHASSCPCKATSLPASPADGWNINIWSKSEASCESLGKFMCQELKPPLLAHWPRVALWHRTLRGDWPIKVTNDEHPPVWGYRILWQTNLYECQQSTSGSGVVEAKCRHCYPRHFSA